MLCVCTIEDVERGAELTASSSNFVFKRPNFGCRPTDRRTDRRNKHILGLPSEKLRSKLFIFYLTLRFISSPVMNDFHHDDVLQRT